MLSALAAGLAAVLLGFGMAGPVQAQMWCDRPRKPFCVEQFGPFLDQTEFLICRQEVEAFRLAIRRYLDCLRDEGQEAVSALNRAIDAFNQRARMPRD
jgi:hypothetical protein